MQNSSRILINTASQYIRSIANIVFAFVATRVVLHTLGVEDYGIYSLIAGIVSLLSFITNSLIITTQRYLSVSQGLGDNDKVVSVFSTSLLLHILVSSGILLLLEFASPFLFNGFLNVSPDRIFAAKIYYQFTVVILFLSFIISPYRASIVSHENIVYASVVEIFEGFLKLIIAFLLPVFSYDKLIVYGALLLFVYMISSLAWVLYARHNYEECHSFNFHSFDSKLAKNILGFAGWTIYSIGCVTGRLQGIAIIINKVINVTANAAYGLGSQVSGALMSLSQSLLNAINPQLMKSEGAGDRQKMLRLAEIESKFAFYMLTALVIPCLFEMPQLLRLWLGSVPDNTVLFCRMFMLASCADMLTIGLNSANQAIGNIRIYTLLIYTIKLSTIVFAWLCLELGWSLHLLAFCYVFIELVSSVVRIPFLVKTGCLNAKSFIKNVFVMEIIPVTIVTAFCLFVTNYLNFQYRFILTFALAIPLYALVIYLFGISKDEKQIINTFLAKVINKYK